MPPKRNPMDRRSNFYPRAPPLESLKITIPGGEIRKRALADISSSVHNTPKRPKKKRKTGTGVENSPHKMNETCPSSPAASRPFLQRLTSSFMSVISPPNTHIFQNPPSSSGPAEVTPESPSLFQRVASPVMSLFGGSPRSMSPPAVSEAIRPPTRSTSPLPSSSQPRPAESLDPDALQRRIDNLRQAVAMHPENQDFLYTEDKNHNPTGCGQHAPYPEQYKGKPPSVQEAKEAAEVLASILRPRRGPNSKGYKDPKFSKTTLSRLKDMDRLLCRYTNEAEASYGKWGRTSEIVAMGERHGVNSYSQKLRRWTSRFIADHETLPFDCFGKHASPPVADENLRKGIREHLRSLGKYFRAVDLVFYVNSDETKQLYNYSESISQSTAKIWLQALGYTYSHAIYASYSDRHEDIDVTDYRQKVYLPRLFELEKCLRLFDQNGELENPNFTGRRVVLWFHDESTFYANDQRQKYWRAFDDKPEPQEKGEGESIMVADFVSADYGWLASPDGKERARVIFRAGKAREGYFTNGHICDHFRLASSIVKKHYPDEDHVFIFDNATTHTARPRGAPSAVGMTKSPSANFGKKANKIVDGKTVYGGDGRPEKERVRMSPGWFEHNGRHVSQSFYFEADGPLMGKFKGMDEILRERGLHDARQLNAKCKQFQCPSPPPGQTPHCCQQRVLYEQPDFRDHRSALQIIGDELGIEVIYNPKFHCELNFIEQCWGYAKRVYRQFPKPKSDAEMEKNIIESLDSVPLTTMRRFARRSFKFADAYRKGLDGQWAVWAAREYRSHRTCPDSLLADLDKAKQEEAKKYRAQLT